MRAEDLFEILAGATWRTIRRAKDNRISFGEDAITSINLSAIASLNGCVAVEDTRATEAQKGCDFEMWIGSANRGWHRYAVQAKKISFTGWRYANLKHAVRGRQQIDILKEYASRARAAPIFCFYNYATDVKVYNCTRDSDVTQLGCMVLPAAVVEDAVQTHGHRNFRWLHRQPEALPWRCLITCPSLHHESEIRSTPSRWPRPQAFWYERLPEEVQIFLEQEGGGESGELADKRAAPTRGAADLLYPGWHVVVDAADEARGPTFRDHGESGLPRPIG